MNSHFFLWDHFSPKISKLTQLNLTFPDTWMSKLLRENLKWAICYYSGWFLGIFPKIVEKCNINFTLTFSEKMCHTGKNCVMSGQKNFWFISICIQVISGYQKVRCCYNILVRNCILKLGDHSFFTLILTILDPFLRTFWVLTPFLLIWDPKYYTYSESFCKYLPENIGFEKVFLLTFWD